MSYMYMYLKQVSVSVKINKWVSKFWFFYILKSILFSFVMSDDKASRIV